MERARIYLASNYPWYAAMLQQCSFKWSTQVPTAGVRLTKKGTVDLAVNRQFWDSLSEQARVGLLMHEMLHVAMKHMIRGQHLEPRQANIAMDISINQYIPKDLLPDGAMLPNQFQLAPGLQFEAYYIELMKRQPPKQQPMDSHDWDQPQDSDGNSETDSQGQSQSQDGDSEEQTEAGSGNSSDQGQDQEQDSAGTDPGLSPELQEQLIDQMLQQAREHAEGAEPGSTPNPVQQAMDASLLERARVSWRQQLRSFVGSRRTDETETTRTRVNRRHGLRAPGYRYTEAPKILIAIDESGSVSTAMLTMFMSEIRGILATVPDKTRIVHFDTEIAHTETLDRYSDSKVQRHASGGTDFNCVLRHAAEYRPDLIIILTDAEAEAPRESVRCPILWAICGEADASHLKGKKVYVK